MKNSKYCLVERTARWLIALGFLFLPLAMVNAQIKTTVGPEGVAANVWRLHKDTGVLQDDKPKKQAVKITSSESLAQSQSRYRAVKQFEETSYYLKSVQFISEEIGWAVGGSHWDQTEKKYTGTIIKTVDGGNTWVAQETGVTGALRGLSFVDANTGWVVGENGTILHTVDGGSHWVKQPVATTDEFRSVVFMDGNQGWATSITTIHYDWLGDPDDWRGSIWHTNNGGLSWAKQTVPDNASILNRVKFVDANNGWVAGIKFVGYDYSDPQHVGVVYHTLDGGKTWQEQYNSNLNIVFTGMDFTDAKNGWVVGFMGNSAMEGGTVFHTTDGGVIWTRLAFDADFFDRLSDVRFVDQNRGYAIGVNVAGPGPIVWRTLDGGVNWQRVRMDRADEEGLYGLAIVGNHLIAVGDHDFISLCADPWGTFGEYGENLFTQHYINTHYRFEDVFFIDENHGWAVGERSFEPTLWGQLIFHTQDGGVTWQTQYEHAPNLDDLFKYTFRVDSVFFVDSQNGWAVGGSEFFKGTPYGVHQGAILHTTDGGLHWQNQGQELSSGWDLEFFAVQFLDSQNGWALSSFTPPSQNIFLAHTTDGGLHWEWVDTGIEGPLAIGFADVQGGLVFKDAQHGWAVGGLGKVIHTQDGGKTWAKQTLDCGDPDCYIRLDAVEFINNEQGWIAGEGLYHTTDAGVHWASSPGCNAIQDIQFLDGSNGWSAGHGCEGSIRYTTDAGNTWAAVDSGTSVELLGLHFVNPSTGWVVGDSGTIIAISKDTSGYLLTVSKLGIGYGKVTSQPAGIDCGSDCNESYASGTPVKLTATPIAGYQFSGWGGACSGYGNACTLTMDAAKSVTANFEVFKKKRSSVWRWGVLL